MQTVEEQIKSMLPQMLGELGAAYRNRLFKHIEGYKQVTEESAKLMQEQSVSAPSMEDLKKDFLAYVEDQEAVSGSSVHFRKD